MYYGGIEAGGTKFVCAVADNALQVIDETSIPTGEPEATLQAVFTFFEKYPLKSLGVGSFGPIGVNPQQADYGHILATPKPGWSHFDLYGRLQQVLQIPIAWTTDVNAAAYGEWKKGAAVGVDNCLYLTVGTGIGGGIIQNGKILTGLSHPETGHIFVKRHQDDDYQGTCPYHGDCLEGLAAGPSLEARTGVKGQLLEENHPVWELEAYYIAQALINYTLILSPEKIILGGGVMNQHHLIQKIRQSFQKQLADYVTVPPLEEYIVPWQLANKSGITGCLLLAEEVGDE